MLCCVPIADSAAVYSSPTEDLSHCNGQALSYIMLHTCMWIICEKERDLGRGRGRSLHIAYSCVCNLNDNKISHILHYDTVILEMD